MNCVLLFHKFLFDTTTEVKIYTKGFVCFLLVVFFTGIKAAFRLFCDNTTAATAAAPAKTTGITIECRNINQNLDLLSIREENTKVLKS
jgi:hypothetical protein